MAGQITNTQQVTERVLKDTQKKIDDEIQRVHDQGQQVPLQLTTTQQITENAFKDTRKNIEDELAKFKDKANEYSFNVDVADNKLQQDWQVAFDKMKTDFNQTIQAEKKSGGIPGEHGRQWGHDVQQYWRLCQSVDY